MIPDRDGRSDGRTECIVAKTALCIASYADALSKIADCILLSGIAVQRADYGSSGCGNFASLLLQNVFNVFPKRWGV